MDGLKRGDFVTIAINGDYGKQRPALIVQSDLFAKTNTVTVLLVTSTIVDAKLFMVTVKQDKIHKISQVMIDKIMTVKRDKIGILLVKIMMNSLQK
jgi:mRNA interferase MazF